MDLSFAQISAFVGAYMWPMIRIGAMALAAPVFSAQSVSVTVRIAFAFALTLILVPVLPPIPAIDLFSAEGIIVAFQQMLIGAVMGFSLQLVFSAFVIGAQILAMQMGLGFSLMASPQDGVQVTSIGQIYIMMVTLLYLAMDGHLILINMMAQSFHTLPIGTTSLGTDVLWQLVSWGSDMFAAAVLISLPAVSALLMVNISFGVMSRAAPQLNLFAVGFPISLIMGFVVLLVTAPDVLPQLTNLLDDIFLFLQEILRIQP